MFLNSLIIKEGRYISSEQKKRNIAEKYLAIDIPIQAENATKRQ